MRPFGDYCYQSFFYDKVMRRFELIRSINSLIIPKIQINIKS